MEEEDDDDPSPNSSASSDLYDASDEMRRTHSFYTLLRKTGLTGHLWVWGWDFFVRFMREGVGGYPP